MHHLARLGGGPAQHGADARQQFARAEGLHQVVVGADLEQQHLVDFIAQGAQHDDGGDDLRGAQLLADLDAVHARQPQIHQDQVGLEQQGFFVTGAAIRHQHGAKAFLLEHHADGVAQALVVVDHQNGLHARRFYPLYLNGIPDL